MPAGLYTAGIWDREAEEYLAISHPFPVPGNDRAVEATLDVPATNRAHLVEIQRTIRSRWRRAISRWLFGKDRFRDLRITSSTRSIEGLTIAFEILPELTVDLDLPGAFVVPDQNLTARVFDRTTGRGIADASISIRSTSIDPDLGVETGVMQKTSSDEDGLALLPPVRPGTVELIAGAPGYSRQAEAVTGTIEAGGRCKA